MKLTILKDVIGQPYIGVKYSIENRTYKPILTLLRKLKYYINDEDIFKNLINNQANRDGVGCWHITLFNSMQCKKFPELLSFDGYEIKEDIEFLGVGKISSGDLDTYYIICKCEELEDIYNDKFTKDKHLHITLGFTKKDLFNTSKDEKTLIFR